MEFGTFNPFRFFIPSEFGMVFITGKIFGHLPIAFVEMKGKDGTSVVTARLCRLTRTRNY
jgi:hypothetical protein